MPRCSRACGILRKDVKELPETCYKTMDCPLTTEQARVYKQLYDKSFHAFQQGQVTALNEGVLMSKLLQVSGGWVYTTTRQTLSRWTIPLEWTLCLRCWKKLMEKCLFS